MTALYRRLLGSEFDALPARVRELHDVEAEARWTGRADVTRGTAWLARSLATILSLPPQGADQPLSVTFTPKGDAEIWSRAFGRQRFISVQRAGGTELHETVGPVTLRMSLRPSAEALSLSMIGATALGIPVPRLLLPKISTREYEEAGRYHFEVEAVMPVIGLLVRYSGWLERDAR